MGRWLTILLVASGCAHSRCDAVATLIYAGLIAAEIAAYEPRPPTQGPLCADDEIDPPHVCPGIAPAPPEQ